MSIGLSENSFFGRLHTMRRKQKPGVTMLLMSVDRLSEKDLSPKLVQDER